MPGELQTASFLSGIRFSFFFFDEVVKAIASGKNKKKCENRVVDLRTDGTYRRHPLI
jgi:hypothetical protein